MTEATSVALLGASLPGLLPTSRNGASGARTPPRELAMLLCNKSNAFYNLGKWNEAFLAAKECLQWDPTYVKGYYRAGYSLLHLLQPYEAARMFFEGLRLLQRSPDQLQVPDFLVGIFTTMSSIGMSDPGGGAVLFCYLTLPSTSPFVCLRAVVWRTRSHSR